VLDWAGDVNGDGYGDVVVLTLNGSRFVMMLVRGGPSGLQTPDAAVDVGPMTPGFDTIQGIGDVNGDGYGDVAVTSAYPAYTPTALVFLGGAAGLPSTPAYHFDGHYRSIPLGDVNGDGLADLLIEQVEYLTNYVITTPQKAYVVKGGATLALDESSTLAYRQYTPKAGDPCYPPKTGPCTYDMKGPFTAVGDVNGDGFADVMLAGRVVQDPIDRIDLYLGSASGLGPAAAGTWTNPDDTQPLSDYNFGWSVAGLGDISGDGFDDVAVGAYQGGSPLFPNRIPPKIRIYGGSSTGLSAGVTWMITSTLSTNLNDSFGVGICGTGG
jgi:hypothetical protein